MVLRAAHRPQQVRTMAAAHRRRDCRLYSPWATFPSDKATSKDLFTNACDAAQFNQGQSRATVLEEIVGDAVVGLLAFRRPAAISRKITCGVVFAINRVPNRSLTHVLEESRELSPSVAHGDAALLVVRECRIRRLRTAGNHVLPRTVGRGADSLSVLACVAMPGDASHRTTIPRTKACAHV